MITVCLETKEGFKKMIKISEYTSGIQYPKHSGLLGCMTFRHWKTITPEFMLYKETE